MRRLWNACDYHRHIWVCLLGSIRPIYGDGRDDGADQWCFYRRDGAELGRTFLGAAGKIRWDSVSLCHHLVDPLLVRVSLPVSYCVSRQTTQDSAHAR